MINKFYNLDIRSVEGYRKPSCGTSFREDRVSVLRRRSVKRFLWDAFMVVAVIACAASIYGNFYVMAQ